MTSQPYLATWFSKNKNLILANLVLMLLPLAVVTLFIPSKTAKPQSNQLPVIIGNPQLYPVYIHRRGWGFINANGAKVIPPTLEEVTPFSEGLAGVKMNGKWGYINETGTLVIQPRFDAAGEFHNGLAKVVFDEIKRFGVLIPRPPIAFINRHGEKVIDCLQFQSVNGFQEGLAAVQIDNKWGFINLQGQVVIQPEFEIAYDFSEGLSLVFKDGKYGFITPSGDWQIPPQLISASSFHNGRAKILVIAQDEAESYGFCDRQGKLVIPAEFEDASNFSEGLAAVRKNGKWGFIDAEGKVVVPFQFQTADSFSSGRAAVFLGNGVTPDAKYGYIDSTGNVVIPARFGKAEPFRGELASVKIAFEPKELSYVNRDGKIIWRTILR
ncbi:MAG: WG repeat-containing protein [Acidobacteria bacterium]|nr:WG repeat-containing protein [Acidobacteriota bacterium]